MFAICRPPLASAQTRRSLATAVQQGKFRVVNVTGLPEGYQLRDVLKAVGYGPIQQVTPTKDALALAYYSSFAARQRELQPVMLDGKAYSVSSRFPRHLSTLEVARLGYYGASRSLYINKVKISEEELHENLRSLGNIIEFGPSARNNSYKVTYFSENTAWQLFQRNRSGVLGGFHVEFTLDGTWNMDTFNTPTTARRVVISNLPESITTQRLVKEIYGLDADSIEVVTNFQHSPKANSAHITFFSPRRAQLFYDIFQPQAKEMGFKMEVVNTTHVTPYIKAAIFAGASRSLYISRYQAPELKKELRSYGPCRSISTKDGYYVEYNHITSALKAVCHLSTGLHSLPPDSAGHHLYFAHTKLLTGNVIRKPFNATLKTAKVTEELMMETEAAEGVAEMEAEIDGAEAVPSRPLV